MKKLKILAVALITALPFAAQAHTAQDWIVPGEIGEENGATLAIDRASVLVLEGKRLVEIQMIDGLAAIATYEGATRVSVDCDLKTARPLDYTYNHRQKVALNYEQMRSRWDLAGLILPTSLSPRAQNHIRLAVCPKFRDDYSTDADYAYRVKQSYSSRQALMTAHFGQAHWANPTSALAHAELLIAENEERVQRVSEAMGREGSACAGWLLNFNHQLDRRNEEIEKLRVAASTNNKMRPYEITLNTIRVHDDIVTRTRRAILFGERCGITTEGLHAQGLIVPAELLPSPSVRIGVDQAPYISPVGDIGKDAR